MSGTKILPQGRSGPLQCLAAEHVGRWVVFLEAPAALVPESVSVPRWQSRASAETRWSLLTTGCSWAVGLCPWSVRVSLAIQNGESKRPDCASTGEVTLVVAPSSSFCCHQSVRNFQFNKSSPLELNKEPVANKQFYWFSAQTGKSKGRKFGIEFTFSIEI